MLNFLKPTRQKVVGTIIVLIALLISSYVNEAITDQLLPEEWFTMDLESALTDIMENDTREFFELGFKILVINTLVNIFTVYLSMCLIFRKKGEM